MTPSPPKAVRADPDIQRVPARTRGPVAAVALAAVALAVLIAKPWEQPRPPDTTVRPVADAPVDNPTAAPSVKPQDAADVAAVFALEIGSPGDVARCLYDTTRKGELRLGAILVLPPRAYVAAPSATERTRNLGWRVELQANRQETLFNAEWTPVSESRLQVVQATDGKPAHFFPMEVQIDPASVGRTSLIRARLIVDWYSPNLADFHRTELLMPAYILGGRASGPVRQDCPGFTGEDF